jgi:magnesium-protoporphyrin O-methyltransferase
MTDYAATRDRVEDYFDRSATKAWERLTSDAPVSGVRATVRAGRDRMRALMLSQLPHDLSGCRVLDAGCGTGATAVEMAARGAAVLAIDISPALVKIAQDRQPTGLAGTIDWRSGDMFDSDLGHFDHVIAMDSMIYYASTDVARQLGAMSPRVSGQFVFTLPPRTPLLMAMFWAGKAFPRSDRSPQMVPQNVGDVSKALDTANIVGRLTEVDRVTTGFYKSTAMVFQGVDA